MAISLQPVRPAAESDLHSMHRPFHFVAFALTTFVLWRFFVVVGWPYLRSRAVGISAGLMGCAASFALGCLIETLQHTMYHNPMEWWDVRDDGLGALGALLIASVIRHLLATRKNPV